MVKFAIVRAQWRRQRFAAKKEGPLPDDGQPRRPLPGVLSLLSSCILSRSRDGQFDMTNSNDTTQEDSTAAPAAERSVQRGWRGIVPGAVLVAIAGLTLYSGSVLPPGTGMHPGPGAAPDIVAALLFILGIIVAVDGAVVVCLAGKL